MVYCLYPAAEGGGEVDEWELELSRDDDYEYGYDYLYENENRPTNAAGDADEPENETWWEEDEEALLEEVRAAYHEADGEQEAASVLDDESPEGVESHSLSFAEILAEIKAEEKARRETGAERAKKRLVRDMKAEALLRMETAARTPSEFRAVQEVWDSNDASRERYERLHEILQDDDSLESTADYSGTTVFPRWFSDPTVCQLMKGYFLDYFADCPYEMHDLLAKPYLRRPVDRMKEDHKELVFFLYLRLFTPQHVAALRGQTDRNIRKVRDVAIRKLRKHVYEELKVREEKDLSLTHRELEFLEAYETKGADLK